MGHKEGVGHKLVSEAAAVAFELAWREGVRSMCPTELSREKDLLALIFSLKREATAAEPAFPVADLPTMTDALLRSARTNTLSQTVGSRYVRSLPGLEWDALVEVYENQKTLVERISCLRASGATEDEETLQLAEKYAAGWRPKQSPF